MKLKWCGSSTGAGMYLDLYEVEGGREMVIGASPGERQAVQGGRDQGFR
jgi:hypothetical protein